MTRQYHTKNMAETCHSRFECTKDKTNLRHGFLNPPGRLMLNKKDIKLICTPNSHAQHQTIQYLSCVKRLLSLDMPNLCIIHDYIAIDI